MYETYAMFYRNLLVQVAFLMMKTTKSEFDQMIKDPEQFINLALDTCDK